MYTYSPSRIRVSAACAGRSMLPRRCVSAGAEIGWIPRGALSSCTPSTSTYGSYGWEDGGIVGAYVFLSTTAGLAASFHAEEQCLQGLRMPVDFVPISPALQTFLAFWWRQLGCQLGCSALSGVKVIADPAGCSRLPRRGISVGACFGRGARMDLPALQITSCKPPTGTFGCCGCDGGWTVGAYVF